MKAKEYTKQGTEHLKKEEYDLAMENYLKASDLGDYYAMYNIACMYYFGDGVEKNDTRALQWYEKAGDAGDPEGNNRAAIMYEMGLGVEKNIGTAFRLDQS